MDKKQGEQEQCTRLKATHMSTPPSPSGGTDRLPMASALRLCSLSASLVRALCLG